MTKIGSTVMAQVSINPPSSVVTVMVQAPTFFKVTTPLTTVATVSSSLSHVTALLVASAGSTVATNVIVPPTGPLAMVWSSVTSVTGNVTKCSTFYCRRIDFIKRFAK